jgi:hypothetical protein
VTSTSPHSEIRLEYLAGYFDGKGCITVMKNGKYPGLRITIVSSDREVVRMFGTRFNKPTRDVTNASGKLKLSSRLERWSLDGVRAVQALRDLEPHLISTKEQARVALNTDWETNLSKAVNYDQLLQSRWQAKKMITRLKRRNRILEK